MERLENLARKMMTKLQKFLASVNPSPISNAESILSEKRMTTKTTHSAGMEIVKASEGLRTKAYKCPAGVWTIGYGHTKGVKAGQVIDAATAEQYLVEDLRDAEHTVNTTVAYPVNQNQFDALVSLVFNIGAGNFASSTLRRRLNAGDVAGAADQFRVWNKARVRGNLVKLEGLVTRRAAEEKLFSTPVV